MPLINNVAVNPEYEGDLATHDYQGDLETNDFAGEYAGDLESNAPTSSNTSPATIGTESVEMRPLIPNTPRAHANVYVGGSTAAESTDNESGRHNRKTNCNIQ